MFTADGAFNKMMSSIKEKEDSLDLDLPEVPPQTESPMSFGSDSSSRSPSPTPFKPQLHKFRKVSRKIMNTNNLLRHPRPHRKSLKLIGKEQDISEEDAAERTVYIYERREHVVKLCNMGTQTDAVELKPDNETVEEVEEPMKAMKVREIAQV